MTALPHLAPAGWTCRCGRPLRLLSATVTGYMAACEQGHVYERRTGGWSRPTWTPVREEAKA